ncbi:tyrosine-type recombinase/integrase [Fusobacterium sp. SYSU M8D902]|uniref:tyrosine-type recombinase/integrase n=1 Tax=Fusobacterium sp. SYSU M8D902 TaxID=3159562 RepID=UPI0032E5188E
MSYSTFKPRFIKLMKELGLEHTIHDTRHTFATLLSNANANPTSIVRLIGHSKFSTTENIYTHKDIKELEKAINLI